MAMQVMVRDVRATYRRTEAVRVGEARDPQGAGAAAAQRRTRADLEDGGPGGDEAAAVTERRGHGSIPARLRMAQTVDAPT
jgi:hypothetical protein